MEPQRPAERLLQLPRRRTRPLCAGVAVGGLALQAADPAAQWAVPGVLADALRYSWANA